MHNVVKWLNILQKSCSVNTARFFKYVWPFYNIMHERVKAKYSILDAWQDSEYAYVCSPSKCQKGLWKIPFYLLFLRLIRLNPFNAIDSFLYPLETSDIFRGYRKRPVAWNWLIIKKLECCKIVYFWIPMFVLLKFFLYAT